MEKPPHRVSARGDARTITGETMPPTAGSYRISTDPARKLLVIRFSGFLTAAGLGNYVAEKNAAIARMRCRPNDHVTLCDFTDCGPQSQEVLTLFAASLADPRHSSRRIAAVVTTALARMQVRRVVTRPDFACFDNQAEAIAWLTSDAPRRDDGGPHRGGVAGRSGSEPVA